MLPFLITSILISSCLVVYFFVDLTARCFLSTMIMHSLALFVDLKGSWCNKGQVIQNTPTDELILGLLLICSKDMNLSFCRVFKFWTLSGICSRNVMYFPLLGMFLIIFLCIWFQVLHIWNLIFLFRNPWKKAKENITWLETSGDETAILIYFKIKFFFCRFMDFSEINWEYT